MWFTVLFTVIATVVEYFIGLSLALLLREKIPGGAFFRVLFAIPMMLAPVAIGFMWRMLYDQSNGPINAVLRGLRLGSPPWLSDSHLAVVSVVIMDVWEWTPLVFLLLLAGLQAIPTEVIDAAKVDGAGGFQVIYRVIVPMLAPVTVTAIFLRMIDSFQVFGQIFLLTGGGPGTPDDEHHAVRLLPGLPELRPRVRRHDRARAADPGGRRLHGLPRREPTPAGPSGGLR